MCFLCEKELYTYLNVRVINAIERKLFSAQGHTAILLGFIQLLLKMSILKCSSQEIEYCSMSEHTLNCRSCVLIQIVCGICISQNG